MLTVALQQLEVEPQSQLNDTRMAAEDQIGPVEVSRADRNQVGSRSARLACSFNAVDRTRNELGMVERVEHIDSELDLHPFTDPEVLEDREVQVVDDRKRNRVSSRV